MKRLLVLLPLLALLAGCSQEKPEQPQPDSTGETEITTQTTTQSAPADQRQPLVSVPLDSEGFLGFISMGKDLLLFEENALAIVDSQTLKTVVREEVQGIPLPESGLVWTRQDGVAYFDESSKDLVFLGTNLKETMRLQLPEDMTGTACLSQDWNTVYYCTASEIRALDMKRGVSRLVMAHPAVRQSVSGVMLEGEVLNCVEQDGNGARKSVLISAKTGEVLYEGTFLTNMVSSGMQYYLSIDHKSVEEIIFGGVNGAPKNLWPAQTPEYYQIFPERNAVITAGRDDAGIYLDYYDLSDGSRSAGISVTGQGKVTGFAAETDGGIWILCGKTMYLWYPDLSPVEDPAVYTAPRYTNSAPDVEGLAKVKAQIQQLQEKYGVLFLTGEEAKHVAPWDYSFEAEYIPQAYIDAISILERAMNRFPENFFTIAAQKSNNKRLSIILVRGIYGALDKGTLASAGGIQYWQDGNLYMALSLTADVERFFYHEMGHIIDTRVLSTGTAFYEWEKLNPPGFRYDNDYIANQNRQDDQYLQDANRWFIDSYSMSFAVEDRSRIFEYACLPGNEKYFISANMQQKLQRVCTGIRQAFKLEGNETRFIWEQYLKK